MPPHISRRLLARDHRRAGAAPEPEPGRSPHPVDELTPREQEVLDLITRGLDNKTIARSLHLRLATVRSHVQRVLEKLNAHSKLEAAALAHEHRRSGCHVPAYRRLSGGVRPVR
jgi:two-component system nitrate/nitrite response regulator NarL